MSPDLPTTAATEDLLPTRYSLLSRLHNWEDHESWREFFDTYWRLIYSVALKAGLTDIEAQEVVQETVICVAKNIQKFQRDRQLGSFKGWLRNLTRWRIADQFKKRTGLLRTPTEGAARTFHPLDEMLELAEEPAGSDWDQEWQAHLLHTAAQRVKQRVKEEQYQIFDLCVFQQWPVKRIAQTLGVSAAQVYLAKHRVSRLFQQEVRGLERQWEAR